jgi:hypothetical protein
MRDLQALVRRAPGRLQSLAGGVSTWTHLERLDAVRERLADLYGYDVTTLRVATALGEEVTESSSSAYVVVAPPDRWRIVERGHVEACDGDRIWSGTSTLVTESPCDQASIRDAGVIGICLYPGPLVSGLLFDTPEPGEVQGRECWVVDGTVRLTGESELSAAALAVSGGRHVREFVGVEHRFWFDAETGIVLRHEGFIDGERCSCIELVDVVIDRPLAATEFGAPPGAVRRSTHELLRDHLAGLGVDPDLVDLDDPDQVRRALRGAL